MINFVANIKQDIKDKLARGVVEKSKEIYQIREKDGELWLTYEGQSVIPCSMLNEEPIKALESLRKLFINSNNNRDL